MLSVGLKKVAKNSGIAILIGGTIFGGSSILFLGIMLFLRAIGAHTPLWLLSTDYWPHTTQIIFNIFVFWGLITMFIVWVLEYLFPK